MSEMRKLRSKLNELVALEQQQKQDMANALAKTQGMIEGCLKSMAKLHHDGLQTYGKARRQSRYYGNKTTTKKGQT